MQPQVSGIPKTSIQTAAPKNTNQMSKMAHFLIITFPLQSHINPNLEFAKRLVRAGAHVTFTTTVSAYRRMIKSPIPDGISYASFSDGYDDGFDLKLDKDSTTLTEKENEERRAFGAQFIQAGAQKVTDLVRTLAEEGRHITCIVYGINQSFFVDVARSLDIPSVGLWIQPATVLVIYYHYFHGYDHLFKNIHQDPLLAIELPTLPPLTYQDLPSFLLPSNSHTEILTTFREQFKTFDKEVQEVKVKPRVLVNTFDMLEGEELGSVDGLDLISIGPLISSVFSDGKDMSDTSTKSSHYMQWLDSKPVSSVIYISFGTIVAPSKQQMEEILNGLLDSGRLFFWVIRVPDNGSDTEFDTDIRSRVGAIEDGLVVPWCSQVEVLSHPSTGCFVTHCGWNSTMESLARGVPMVCFPQWTDQMTTAKLVEDVWKMGVRVKVNEDGMLEGGELKRCLAEVMGGERGEEIKKNAVRWRDLAREAVGEGGSSDLNMRAFVEEMKGGCSC